MFSHYKQEIIAQDVMNRITEIKTKITALGWEHFINTNQQRASLRTKELAQRKDTRHWEEAQKGNEQLELKLKSIVSTFDMVNHRIDKVSDMMSIFQSIMEKSFIESSSEKETATESKLSGRKPRTENILLNNSIKNGHR